MLTHSENGKWKSIWKQKWKMELIITHIFVTYRLTWKSIISTFAVKLVLFPLYPSSLFLLSASRLFAITTKLSGFHILCFLNTTLYFLTHYELHPKSIKFSPLTQLLSSRSHFFCLSSFVTVVLNLSSKICSHLLHPIWA